MHQTIDSAGCAFCAIIAGAQPAAEVLRTDAMVGFLDRRPLFHGHVLLSPVDHVVTLEDLPGAQVGPFFQAAQRVCAAVREAMDAPGTFVAMNNVVSQSVPHLHCHVVPRRPKDGLRGFFWPRTTYEDDAQRDAVAARIAGRLEATR